VEATPLAETAILAVAEHRGQAARVVLLAVSPGRLRGAAVLARRLQNVVPLTL